MDTLSLMREVEFDHAFMFMYSERPDTYAQKKYVDDVPVDVKKRRLAEIIDLQTTIARKRNEAEIGSVQTVLVEGSSKRSEEQLAGRADSNKMVVFDKADFGTGDYVSVRIASCTSATLIGDAIAVTTLDDVAAASV